MEAGYNIQWYAWQANTNQYPWARNPYENQQYRWYVNYSKSGSTAGFFNECGSLAKWMVDKGWRVDITSGLSEVQPGDIIFFAEKMNYNDFPMTFETMLEGYNYRGITHAAICTEVIPIFERFSGPVEERGSPSYPGKYDYQLTIITTPSFMEQYLRNTSGGWNSNYDVSWNIKEETLQPDFEYTNSQGLTYCLYSMDTIAMVCRPDLSSNQKTYLEQEAENLGLHVVPENETQLNIIKRCRLCTDIEWTPGIDYARPMPITGTYFDIDQYYTSGQGGRYFYDYFGGTVLVEGSFNEGEAYKGIPWTPRAPQDIEEINPDTGSSWGSVTQDPNSGYGWYKGFDTTLQLEQFISTIGNDNASYTLAYRNAGEIYPYYGWNQPIDFLRFVFGTETCYTNYTDDAVTLVFNQPVFYCEENSYLGDDIIWPQYQLFTPDDFKNLKLGDIICNQNTYYSAAIVTDLKKDSLGNIIEVELSEASRYGLVSARKATAPRGNVIRRKWWTLDQLYQWYFVQDAEVTE